MGQQDVKLHSKEMSLKNLSDFFKRQTEGLLLDVDDDSESSSKRSSPRHKKDE